MAKKKSSNRNDIGMAYRVEGPRGMSRATVYRAMIEAIRDGTGNLPTGVKVTWKWRNSKKQDMREDSFRSVIRKSRAGFLTLMERRITRDAARLPNWEETPRESPPPRKIPKKKSEPKPKRESKGRREGETRARELKAKRSAAAKKGWKTRRAAAAKKGKKPK